MKLTKINADRLDQITAASGGSIKFRTVDKAVTSIEFPGPFGPVFVEVGSYTVSINERATRKVWSLGFFISGGGEKVFVEKTFKHEDERAEYISRNLSDVDQSELSLSEQTVLDEG